VFRRLTRWKDSMLDRLVARSIRNLLAHPAAGAITHEVAVAMLTPLVWLSASAASDVSSDEFDMFEDCAIACRNLSARRELHNALIEADMVPAVIKLSKVPSPVVQNMCSVFLCNLSHDEDIAAAMTRQDVVPALIALGKDTTADTQRRCAAALRNLSQLVDLQSMIMKQGAVEALLALMKTEVRLCASFRLLHVRVLPRLCPRLVVLFAPSNVAAACTTRSRTPCETS